jgi:hypothetical protein
MLQFQVSLESLEFAVCNGEGLVATFEFGGNCPASA